MSSISRNTPSISTSPGKECWSATGPNNGAIHILPPRRPVTGELDIRLPHLHFFQFRRVLRAQLAADLVVEILGNVLGGRIDRIEGRQFVQVAVIQALRGV